MAPPIPNRLFEMQYGRSPTTQAMMDPAPFVGRGEIRSAPVSWRDQMKDMLAGYMGRHNAEMAMQAVNLTPAGAVFGANEGRLAYNRGQFGEAAMDIALAATYAAGLPGVVGKAESGAARELARIAEYNASMRAPRTGGAVSLDRSPVFNSAIPYQPENYYRLVGSRGLDDFERSGVVRANPNNKMQYDNAYYESGKANNIYAKNGGGDVAIEVRPSQGRFDVERKYPRTRQGEEITANDPMRIWARNQETRRHEIIFDNIGDAVSYAKQYGGRPVRQSSGAFVVVPETTRQAQGGTNPKGNRR